MLSGLLRNAVAIAKALPHRGSLAPTDTAVTHFRVTPFDVGIATLKSERYPQFAEAAQLDWLIRTGLLARLRAARCGWINGAQMVRFARPVRLFDRVEVRSRVVWADARWAWFAHTLHVRGAPHGEVLVKMKFKQGALTLPPAGFVGPFDMPKPVQLQHWDDALAAAADAPPG